MRLNWSSKRFMALIITIFMVVTVFAGMSTTVFAAASSINVAGCSVYGNFETAGVIIKVDNMNFNETATLEYKKTTDGTYKTGHYLVRFDGNHMATSLFNLALNTTYNIRVTLSDPDGVTGTNPYTTTVTTKAEYALPTPLRIVNVANNTQFDAAVRAALPGDELRLDPVGGPYGLDWSYIFNDYSGTAAHPFVITSSSSSVKPLITSGISIQYRNYVVLNNLEIHAEGGNGVNMRGAHDNVVRNCYIHDSAPCTGDYTADIMITHSEETAAPYQYIGNHLIINNVLSDEIHDPLVDTSNAPTLGQCYNGVTFLYQPGGFNTVRGNTIYGVVDGINTCGDEGQNPVMGPNDLDVLNTWHDQNLDVYDNNIYNCGDDGIQNDGHMTNGREFRNRIGRVMCAITTAPMYPGPFFFVRNYVYGFVEQASKQNTGVAGTIRNCFFYQNTFVERDRSQDTFGNKYCFYRGEPAQVTDFTYKNNIIYAQGRIYNGDLYLADPALYYYRNYTMDYNTIFTTRQTDPTYMFKWVTWYGEATNNVKYTDLAGLRAGTGQEMHGTYGYPMLDYTMLSGYPAGSYMANLRILGGSAAIDKGVVIPGITDGYLGAAPDCGAYESNGTEPPGTTATPTTTPLPTNTPTPSATPIARGSGTTLNNLGVYDSANAVDWSIQANLQIGNLAYGDRTGTIDSVAAYLVGKEYIRTANDSKAYTGSTLCTFIVTGNSDVYVAHNNNIVTKPAWMSSFTNTGDVMIVAGNNCTLFKKTYSAGARVDLGPNGDTSMSTYIVIINPIGGATSTPLPTATNTPLPTATNTPLPTATNTPLPTATNTPGPTATNTPTPGGPVGYTWCAVENGTVVFSQTVNVAYGANGLFNYLYGVTGSITFNNATFGDPIVGTAKNGYYLNVTATPTNTPIPTATNTPASTPTSTPPTVMSGGDIVENFTTAKTFTDGFQFGTGNILTMETAGSPVLSNSTLTCLSASSPQKADAFIIRSTNPLPARYKVSVDIGNINFDLLVPADEENGMYFPTIMSALPQPTTNDWFHQNRKIIFDTDNNVWGEGGTHPIFVGYYNTAPVEVFYDGATSSFGSAWLSITSYTPNNWYTFEIEKTATDYIWTISNANTHAVIKTTSIAIASVRGSGLPDYLCMGDTHTNYYNGSVRIANIRIKNNSVTSTPTNTPLPTATNTPLPTATNTPLPTATSTATPTATIAATPTPVLVSMFSDGFESNNFTVGGWTATANVATSTTQKRTGTYSARFKASGATNSLTKALSTAGKNNIQIIYYRYTTAFTTARHFIAEWYNGTAWTTLEDLNSNVSTWTQKIFNLPVGASNNAAFQLRFKITGTNGNVYTYLDDVQVLGANSATPTPVATATPVTITLQQGVNSYAGAKDQGYLCEDSSSNAGYYGAGQAPILFFRDWAGSSNALMYFDLTGQIPAGKTIDSAILSLYQTAGTYTAGNCNLHRVTDPNSKGMWAEGTTGAQYDKDGAAWNRRTGTGDTTTIGWTNTAGSHIMDSVVTTATGAITLGITVGWFTSADLKTDVQAWVNGTAVNQGWYVRTVSGGGLNSGNVASDQNTTTTYRPKLTVTYH